MGLIFMWGYVWIIRNWAGSGYWPMADFWTCWWITELKKEPDSVGYYSWVIEQGKNDVRKGKKVSNKQSFSFLIQRDWKIK